MFASKATDVLRIKKLNTLFISYDGMTDSLGQSQVIPYLIGLSKSGYKITLISCEKPEALAKNQTTIAGLLVSHSIDWHPLPYTKRPPVVSTLMDLMRIKSKMKELHFKKKFKLVHCRSYISSLAATNFCKKKDIPFVFDMRGFWADERVEGKIWNLKNPLFNLIYTYFKKKEIEFVNQAAAVVSLTHAGKREILSWPLKNKAETKIVVIPCSADFDLFSIKNEDQKASARKALGIDGSAFILVYLGSLGTWYLLEEMLDFFKVLKVTYATAKFYIITNDDKHNIVRIAVRKGIPESDLIIESAKREEVPQKLAAGNWGISFIKPSFSKTASSPTKMGEMLAMGIPLVVNDKVGDVRQICETSKGGICISEFSEKSYQWVVQQIKESVKPKPEEIRSKSFEIYSLDKAIESYKAVYQMCLQENNI